MTSPKKLFLLLVTAAVLTLASHRPAQAKGRVFNIGVVADGPARANDLILDIFKREISVLTEDEFRVRFPEDKAIIADWTPQGVSEAISKLLADPKVHLVLCMGTLASTDCGRREKLKKPVIAPFVLDPAIFGIPFTENGTSGRTNLAYLSLPQTFERDLQVFRELIPFKKVAVLVDGNLVSAVPDYQQRMRESVKDMAISLQIVVMDDSASKALAEIASDVDAVYVRSLLRLPDSEREILSRGLIDRKLPSFALLGYSGVVSGLLAGTRPESDFTVYARHTALLIQRILLNEGPATLPVHLPLNEQLSLNMKTARAIGYAPGWQVLTDALLIENTVVDGGQAESLSSVVQTALESNIDLAAAKTVVAAGKYSIREAWSGLLPKVEASTQLRQVDTNTAESSLGLEPQRLWTGTISAKVIVAEPLFAGVTAQKRLQVSRENEYEQARLDVVTSVAVAYLNVLRAKTLEQIQRQNLRATRSHLALSRSRVTLGSGTQAEVHRFESQLANNRRAVVEASTQRSVAEAALNRILNRPIDEPFATAKTVLDEYSLLPSKKQLIRYLDDPNRFAGFRSFLIQESLTVTPRLKALDAAIAAQERQVKSRRLAYGMPTMAVIGRFDRQLYRGGIGKDGTDLPGIGLIQRPDQQWFVGVNLSVPLFSGGGDHARASRAQVELHRLELQRQALQARIREQVYAQVQALASAHAAIALSRDAAEAARKNLDLVSDAYGAGSVTIIQIVDAQNVALVAEQVAANAVYDFWIQWMNVQRTYGRLDLLMTEGEVAEFFHRADRFVASVGSK